MLTRDQVVGGHRSPAAWWLIALGAAAALELAGVVGWNVWERRQQLVAGGARPFGRLRI